MTADAGIEAADLLDMAANPAALRMAVPNGYDLFLKPVKDLTEEDHARLADHFERERAYSAAMAKRLDNTLELLGGNSGEWKPGQTVAERLEDLDREIGEDLDRGGAG